MQSGESNLLNAHRKIISYYLCLGLDNYTDVFLLYLNANKIAMNDNNNKHTVSPGLSNLTKVKAFSTIHTATGASVKTISVAVEYSIARDLGVTEKGLDGLVESAGEDPALIKTILTHFGTELMEIRREDMRSLQAELGLGSETLANKPRAARKKRDRSGKPQPG